MKDILRATILITALVTCAAFASAEVSSSLAWWTYIAEYDGIPGSTRIDMGQRNTAPLATLPYIVIAGVEFQPNDSSGLPNQEELERLNSISDPVIEAILATGPSVYVGTFTHNGKQEHYVYVHSLAGTEEAFRSSLLRVCPSCKPLYRTKADPEWNTYLKFLYPNQATIDFYGIDPKRLRPYKP